MDHFSWSDSIRAAFSPCIPCLRRSYPSQSPQHDPHRVHPDELEGLLADVTDDTDTEAETLSLHSNPSEHRRNQQRKIPAHKSITLFGFNLFGRPPIRLPDDDGNEDLNTLPRNRRRQRGIPHTISSITLDSDAAPLDPSAIDGLSPAELQERALAAAEEDRQLKYERSQRRKERKELKKIARALAVGGMGDEEFQGFKGSGSGTYPRMPQPFLPTSSDTRPERIHPDNDVSDVDLGGELYARRSTPENSNGSDSRSRTSSRALSQDAPMQNSTHHNRNPPDPRKKKSPSSPSTSQSPSLPSPILSSFPHADVATAPSETSHNRDELIVPPGYGFPRPGLSGGLGVRVKNRDLGAFLGTRGDA